MPPISSHSEIVDYWSTHEDESGLGVDWVDAHERCWRCGYKSKLDRCHIIPESVGGANDASNLVLLCKRCHRDSPNVSDPRFMWIWLRSTCVAFYDMYLTVRGVEEFELMFGRKPFENQAFYRMDEKYIHKALRKQLEKTIIHFAEGRRNPSTIASILALVEEELTGIFPEPVRTSSVSHRLYKTVGFVNAPVTNSE